MPNQPSKKSDQPQYFDVKRPYGPSTTSRPIINTQPINPDPMVSKVSQAALKNTPSSDSMQVQEPAAEKDSSKDNIDRFSPTPGTVINPAFHIPGDTVFKDEAEEILVKGKKLLPKITLVILVTIIIAVAVFAFHKYK